MSTLPDSRKFGGRNREHKIGDILVRSFRDALEMDVENLDDTGRISAIFAEGWGRVWKRLASLQVPAEAAERVKIGIWQQIKAHADLCESPIERELLVALMLVDYPGIHLAPIALHSSKDASLPGSECVLIPQFAFVKYRLDFALVVRHRDRQLIVDIECDGADFHTEASKAVKDFARDEYLRSWGVPVFRFTGKEIYESALGCANKVMAHVIEWRANGAPDS